MVTSSIADGTAFVVDPEAQTLTMVDVAGGEVYRELDLPVVPHEIQVATGTASGEYEIAPGAAEHQENAGHAERPSDGGGDHEDHDDHTGHDH